MRSLLLIISGSVAAYKSLELIRLCHEQNIAVTAILTKGGAAFITPLAVSSLTGRKTYDTLFSLTDEVEMGHIELSRSADAILVAPASADILAKMANGIADDLATTALLATNKPVFIAPAMNHKMWSHPATQRNVMQLAQDGITIIPPTEGSMACGEYGVGRMAEPAAILQTLLHASTESKPLAGKKAVVTSGPTHEPIDPVRYIANRSSGKQGHAIAASLARAGAEVTLISGPTQLAPPLGVRINHVTTAKEMLDATLAALPSDIVVCAAAVSDWHVAHIASLKIKKTAPHSTPRLTLVENPDILAQIAQHKTKRPALVIGFAAETNNVLKYARDKRRKKQCDWMVANDVSSGQAFERDDNSVTLLTDAGEERFEKMSKIAIADALTARIAASLLPVSTPKKRAK